MRIRCGVDRVSIQNLELAVTVNGFQYTECVTSLPSKPTVPEMLAKMGATCPKCGHMFKERQLFTGTFVGCMC